MKVEIKKSKITKSILKQIVKYQIDVNDEVLGWCIIDNMKWMIFYNNVSNLLNKSPLIKSVELVENFERVTPDEKALFYYVKLFFENGHNIMYCFERNLNSAKDFIKKLENVIKECRNKGQFYV